jgi:hypothetical protein
MNMRRWTLVGAIAVAALAGMVTASAAGAARFKIAFAGQDTLTWKVTEGPGASAACGRSGLGSQVVRFADAHPITTQIGPAPQSGHPVGFGPKRETELALPGRATMTRVDETTVPAGCTPIPVKDCGAKPLPAFFPVLGAVGSNRVDMTAEYWRDVPEGPFGNCLALQTPEGLLGSETFYHGWSFGTVMPENANVRVATPPLSLSRISRGRTYRVGAHTSFGLSDHDLHGSAIFFNGVPPGTLLGGPASVSDSLSWQITLTRVG